MNIYLKTCSILLTLFMVCNQSGGQSSHQSIENLLQTVKQGETLPDNAFLIELGGDTTFYKELKGEWLFLDYWSATCIPCIKEMPSVKALSKRFSETGVRVVMINLDKSEKRWERGIANNEPPEPHYRTDRNVKNGFFAINLVELESSDGSKSLSTLMPQYVLINSEGLIVDKKMLKPSDPNFEKTLKTYKNKIKTR